MKRKIRLVPVIINGQEVKIDANSVKKADRVVRHGEFKGTKVNSPETAEIGESVLIWPEAGKYAVISMSKAALGVVATQFLQAEGQTVKST